MVRHPKDTLPIKCGTIMAILLLASCATGPAAVREMDAAEVQQLSEYRLCDAKAVWLEQGRTYPVIEDEIRRRGISCAEHIASVVSDCSMLELIGVDTQSSTQGTIFTVRNHSERSRAFRIYASGIQSSRFAIGSGETRSFGVAVDPRLAAVAGATSGHAAAELNECRAI